MRGTTSYHNGPIYHWGPQPLLSTVGGSRGGTQYRGEGSQYRSPVQEPFNDCYSEQLGYEDYDGRPRYEGPRYSSDTQGMWENIPKPTYIPPWSSCLPYDDMDTSKQYQVAAKHQRPGLGRPKKHVPLNWQGTPDTAIDSPVCKSLNQDLMKFSAELNPVFGWKSQPEEA
jgi:hypothetical protein